METVNETDLSAAIRRNYAYKGSSESRCKVFRSCVPKDKVYSIQGLQHTWYGRSYRYIPVPYSHPYSHYVSHQEAYEFLALLPVTHEKIIPREVIAKVFGGHPVKAAHESFQPAVIRVDTLDTIFLSIPVCGPSIRLHLDQADLTVSGKRR